MSEEDLLAGLTPEQRDAVLHRDGPLLIVAGAGSGKTRVVTRRIAHLARSGVPRNEILAITFTNKAAGEMRERVEALLPPAPRAKGVHEGPTVSTFHSLAVKILRQHADRVGFQKDFSILDPDDQLALVREAAIAARVDVERFKAPLLAHVIGRAKEHLDDAGFTEHAKPGLEQAAARVLPIYRQLARDRNAMDFDDLVAKTVELLAGHADVHAELLDRFRYVSVDEYQDTNHAQYRLARLLAGERRNLAVVGDPDQSIYGWRGADVRNILRFEEDFPDAKVVRLEKNYRSTATILHASNALIQHNLQRKDKQLVPTAGDGGPIEVVRCLDEELEAEWVGQRVEQAIQLGTKPSEIAIVYRANALSRRYEEALLRRGIPFATVGTVSFFDRREVKDALAYLRLAANPKDDLAALRALKTPPRGLGARTFEKLHEFQRKSAVSLVEACRRSDEVPGLSPHAKTALGSFAGLIGDLSAAASGSVERLVEATLERTKFEDHLRATDEKGQERCENLRALLDAAREDDRRSGGGARDFLERLALRDAQDSDSEEKEKVSLTSVHASKGLEFDVVFCVALEEGLFPHQRALDEGGLEEERRLAYVAFTRAKKRLVLTYASLRGGRASSERRSPSTFLLELPRKLLWDPERSCVPELIAAPPRPSPVPAASAPAARDEATPKTAEKVPLWRRGLIATSTGPKPGAPPEEVVAPATPDAVPVPAPRPTAVPVGAAARVAREPAPVRATALAPLPPRTAPGASGYAPGARVRHARLGDGVVTEVSRGRTGGERLRIRFDDGGERWLVLAYESASLSAC